MEEISLGLLSVAATGTEPKLACGAAPATESVHALRSSCSRLNLHRWSASCAFLLDDKGLLHCVRLVLCSFFQSRRNQCFRPTMFEATCRYTLCTTKPQSLWSMRTQPGSRVAPHNSLYWLLSATSRGPRQSAFILRFVLSVGLIVMVSNGLAQDAMRLFICLFLSIFNGRSCLFPDLPTLKPHVRLMMLIRPDEYKRATIIRHNPRQSANQASHQSMNITPHIT